MNAGGAAPPRAAIRLFIVTPIRLYRDGLAHYLHSPDRVAVVGTAADERETVELVATVAPDVVLLDMATENSRETARSLRRIPGIAVVALAVPNSATDVANCAEAGIAGYVSRDASLPELLAAIRAAHRGEATCSPRVAAELFRRIATLAAAAEAAGAAMMPSERLTPRENEVLELLDRGLSNQQIARRLRIGLPTVKNHVHSILDKLGARSRGEAVARVRRAATPVG